MKAPGVDSLVVLWWQRGVMRTLSGARLGAVLATLPLILTALPADAAASAADGGDRHH